MIIPQEAAPSLLHKGVERVNRRESDNPICPLNLVYSVLVQVSGSEAMV
jgi:hypothetical protein